MTPEQIRDRAESDLALKFCGGCHEPKPVSEFHKNKSRKDGLATQCKVCVKVHTRRNYDKNKEFRYKRYLEHRSKNPEYYLEAQKKWRNANKHVTSFFNQKYRSKKRNAMPSWLTESQISQIRDMYWVAKDLRAISGQEYHVDHIVPLNGKGVCGLHVPWNLQILPADLNLRKSNNHDP